MAIHVTLALALAGSLSLLGILNRWAKEVSGARLLMAFLAGVALWIVGNELPTWFGGGVDRIALTVLAISPITAAIFLHFTLVFTATASPAWLLPAAYAVATAAMLLSMVLRPGTFEPFAGTALMAMPNTVGWITSAVWAALAGSGQMVLLVALVQRRGLAQRQVAAVMASSAWGLLCMSGYAITALRLPVYPWPILGLPAYPIILVYGILRYRVFVANAWARRALVWTMLTGLALLIVALVPLLPLDGAVGRAVAGGLVAIACLGLLGPIRRAAERLVYPGGEMSPVDLAYWQAALARTESQARLADTAAALLRRRLGLEVGVVVGEAAPALPGLACRRTSSGWTTRLEGWTAAPPGPRHLAELFGNVLAQEAERLERASLLASRERDRQIQARFAELGQLAATVAHDVRNPLNIINMAAAGSPAEVRQEIREQVNRIAQLSQDLLDYAKPWQVDPVELDAAAQLESVTQHYPSLELGAGLRQRLTLRADPRRLQQALGNVLDNARATGARMAIDAECLKGAVLLHVCDAGPGIPHDLRDRLFQPFVSRSPGGTGLGLAIVARIMEAHGGRALLTDRPGWSTCVTLEFPA